MLLFLLAACAPKHASETRPLLLWRIERDGHVSHLLGTCHVGVSLDDALPAPHDAALNDATVVYTEADLDMSDIGSMLRLIWNDTGLSLRLPRARWDAMAWSVRDTLPAPLLDHLEPWAANMLVSMAAGGAQPGKQKSMDAEVQHRAKARGIRQEHVETLEEQAGMLAKWNDSFLEQLGVPQDGAKAQTEALDDLCLRGDISHAEALFDPNDPTTTALVEARNRAWVPRLLPDLAQGGAFVAVGAAHLIGDTGLVALLQAEGFHATRLETNAPAPTGSVPWAPHQVEVPPPAPPDLDATSASLGENLANALCADGQMLRTCFAPDAAACRSRVTVDTGLCLRQHVDLLAPDRRQDLQGALTGCVPAGIILDALAHDRVGDAPMCVALQGAMRAAMKGMGG